MRKYLGKSVYEATQERISLIFDEFERVYVSFSGGKDSTVMTHMVMDEAKRRDRTVGILFVDLEGQYKLTIEHVRQIIEMYSKYTDPFWICKEIHLRNAVSQYDSHWVCWDTEREDDWIRTKPSEAFDGNLPFFKRGMEFEEFTPLFGEWYAQGKPCCCMVGIRTAESLNRWRTIASDDKTRFRNHKWTTRIAPGLFNAYPIYDWKTEDIWTYHAMTGLPYNRLYDLMHKAGLSIHQQRICQPYGDDQRKGLWLFHIIEPETWSRIVARVNGANQGALYAKETGNILGRIKITKPPGHTWESFAMLLLGSMPKSTRIHYTNKIAVFIKWWRDRGVEMRDDGSITKSSEPESANWKRICKALLRNDYWCKGLSFSQHATGSYKKYLELMRRRRKKWGILPPGVKGPVGTR